MIGKDDVDDGLVSEDLGIVDFFRGIRGILGPRGGGEENDKSTKAIHFIGFS